MCLPALLRRPHRMCPRHLFFFPCCHSANQVAFIRQPGSQIFQFSSTASLSSAFSRRRPPRHLNQQLSRDVAVSGQLRSGSRNVLNHQHHRRNSPFGGMNQRTAFGLDASQRSTDRKAGWIERSGKDGKDKKGVLFSPAARTDGRVRTKDQNGGSKAGPYKALRMQASLASVSYGRRAVIKEHISDLDRFDKFVGLLPLVRECVKEALGLEDDPVPTPIQRLAIPALILHKGEERREVTRRSGVEGGSANATVVRSDANKENRTRQRWQDSSTHREILLAAETGSGKTLAYLIPTIDAVKRLEMADRERTAAYEKAEQAKLEADPTYVTPPVLSDPAGRPRAVILVPTAELVDQVTFQAKRFCHSVKFRVSGVSSKYTGTVIRNRIFGPGGVDILVSTPHLLASIVKSGEQELLSRVRYLVLDEGDSLLDKSFFDTTIGQIYERVRSQLARFVICTATIPKWVDNQLREKWPRMERLTTPNLHAVPRRVRMSVVDACKDPYRGSKDLACADVIWGIARASASGPDGRINHVDKDEEDRGVLEGVRAEGNEELDAVAKQDAPSPSAHMEKSEMKRIIVFVNEREETVRVAKYLRSKNIDAVAFNRDAPEGRDKMVLEEFTDRAAVPRKRSLSASSSTVSAPSPQSSFDGPESLRSVKVLVTTDIASRGIDTTAVRYVILYNVPRSTVDFLHRLGRTGRMGRRGRAVVLVGKDDRRDVVKEVREGMFMGKALI